MTIDRKHLGYALSPFAVTVSPERLARFADAIGERNPVYRGEIAPPTFLKVLEGEDNSSRRILETLGVELSRVLHAEQQFDYLDPVRAGDELKVEPRVSDLYDKKGGEMDFFVMETSFTGASGRLVARSRPADCEVPGHDLPVGGRRIDGRRCASALRRRARAARCRAAPTPRRRPWSSGWPRTAVDVIH
ncbi:FAS1-like dehydratase domain-containing protein [Aromatoleum toluclasticum]|uniref:FAS1-like dehydratase domain-containing protein n=1 Tax=Aromatoleum toluclasticum TaxID=92003 RepID=UPI00039A7812|nr:MaoC family dehydratase N-terminal domain-containing protein [Aromatoleum toluclasticum]